MLTTMNKEMDRNIQTIADLRINETMLIGEVGNLAYRGVKAVRKPHLPFSCWVGAVVCVETACPDPRDPDKSGLETAPTKYGERKRLSIFRIHHKKEYHNV